MIDVKKLAEKAGIDVSLSDVSGPLVYEAEQKHLEAFAALVLEEAAKSATDAAIKLHAQYKDEPGPANQPYASNRILHAGWNASAVIRAMKPAKEQT